MKTSATIGAISPALIKAQTAMKCALKDATNPHFKSRYADLASVIDAVKAALNTAGIVFLQPVSATENGVAIETTLLHSSGEWIAETLVVPVDRQSAQAVGSAITYGRRYALQALCGVPAEDDDGNEATKSPGKPATTITPTTGLWEQLDDQTRSELTDLASVMTEYLADNDIKGALDMLERSGIDNEQKAALWTRFDSKQRSAMKRFKQESALRASLVTQPLATQA